MQDQPRNLQDGLEEWLNRVLVVKKNVTDRIPGEPSNNTEKTG